MPAVGSCGSDVKRRRFPLLQSASASPGRSFLNFASHSVRSPRISASRRSCSGVGSANVRRRAERCDVLHQAGFGDAVEEREELVVLALRDRIVLVIVAAGAADREAEPDGRGRLDAIDDILDAILLVDDAGFVGHHVIAIEAGRDLLIERRIGQQVAGELLDGELIERQVRVEGPITQSRHGHACRSESL